MNKKTLKSIWAVLAGFLTVVILSVVTDVIVEALGILPSANNPEAYTSGHLFIALVYRTIYTVAGGFVTAKLAPGKQMKHIMVLGILGTIGGVMGIFAGLQMKTEMWYPIALAVLAYPSVWFGGKLEIKKQ